jgi:hypothetical protein
MNELARPSPHRRDHPGLRRHEPRECLWPERLLNLCGRYELVGSACDPRLGLIALAVLPELLEQVVKPATNNACGCAAAKEAAEHAAGVAPRFEAPGTPLEGPIWLLGFRPSISARLPLPSKVRWANMLFGVQL